MARSEAEADEIREVILGAARAEAGRFGIERTRMEDIARRAGISRPNLYNYFGSKEELMVALVEQIARRINDYFDATLPIEGPAVPLFLKRMAGGIPIGLQDELTREMHATHNEPTTWLPMNGWWTKALRHARQRGELVADLTDEDAIRWIRFVQIGVLEHPERFEDQADIERFFEKFAIPPLLG